MYSIFVAHTLHYIKCLKRAGKDSLNFKTSPFFVLYTKYNKFKTNTIGTYFNLIIINKNAYKIIIVFNKTPNEQSL